MTTRNRSNDSTRLAKLAERQFATGDKRAALASLKLLFDLARRENDCALQQQAGVAVRRLAGELGQELEPRFRNRKSGGRKRLRPCGKGHAAIDSWAGTERICVSTVKKKRNTKRPKVKVRVKTKVTVKVRNASLKWHLDPEYSGKGTFKAYVAKVNGGYYYIANRHPHDNWAIHFFASSAGRGAHHDLGVKPSAAAAKHHAELNWGRRQEARNSATAKPKTRNCGIRNAKFWGN